MSGFNAILYMGLKYPPSWAFLSTEVLGPIWRFKPNSVRVRKKTPHDVSVGQGPSFQKQDI
jgi:hypothetical protein